MKIKLLNEEVANVDKADIVGAYNLIQALKNNYKELVALEDRLDDEYREFYKSLEYAEENETDMGKMDTMYAENDRLVEELEEVRWYINALEEHIKELERWYGDMESVSIEWNDTMCKRYKELTEMEIF